MTVLTPSRSRINATSEAALAPVEDTPADSGDLDGISDDTLDRLLADEEAVTP